MTIIKGDATTGVRTGLAGRIADAWTALPAPSTPAPNAYDANAPGTLQVNALAGAIVDALNIDQVGASQTVTPTIPSQLPAVTTSGQVLTTDTSIVPSGIKWAAPTGGSAGPTWNAINGNINTSLVANNNYIITGSQNAVLTLPDGNDLVIGNSITIMVPDNSFVQLVPFNTNSDKIYTNQNSIINIAPKLNAPKTGWGHISSGNNGVVQFATTNLIYKSTDSGNTWVATTAPNTWWTGIACSYDNTTIVATEYNGSIWTSTDSGATWNAASVSVGAQWWGAAISYSGMVMAAIDNNTRIWVSTTQGATWFATGPTANYLQNKYWQSIAMNNDGSIMAAILTPGVLCVSTNSGSSWTQINIPGVTAGLNDVAMSADGLTIVVADTGTSTQPGGIYKSIDSGNTWNKISASGAWSNISIDVNGNQIIASDSGKYIWVYNNAVWTLLYTDSASGIIDVNIAKTNTYTNYMAASGNGWIFESSPGNIVIGPYSSVTVTYVAYGSFFISSITGSLYYPAYDLVLHPPE
jgi:hypothetical protein